MDLLPSPGSWACSFLSQTHYMSHTEQIRKATKEEKKSNLSAAAAHLRKDAVPDEILNVTVTCDATWQKRGHQSLYGVMVVASWETGQVLDIEVLSKWCKDCHAKRHLDPTSIEFLDWWEKHQGICTINYCGSSSAMEREHEDLEAFCGGAQTQIHDHNFRGDSSRYPTIAAEKPYGPNHLVKKMECVGHVQKRMYAHLKPLRAGRTKVRMERL